jgi:hypothetical protein
MPGMPLKHIVQEVHEALQQTIDDAQITEQHVAHWVIMVANRLKMQHISKRDSGAHLHVYSGVPLERNEKTSNPDQVGGRYYFKLPDQVFDFDGDGGIHYISYSPSDDDPRCPPRFTKTQMYRTTPSKAQRLYMNPYEEPTPRNPYFYRVHDHVYLLGLEGVNVEAIEVGIFSIIPPVTEVDMDAPIDFPEETIAILQRQVLDLGRFALMMPQEDINEGRNRLGDTNVPSNKISSVEDMRGEEGQSDNET